VFLGDRQGQVDCFVRLSNQFVQVQLQIEFSWSRCHRWGHHSRFVVADEGLPELKT
jgi:hypothetical protein